MAAIRKPLVFEQGEIIEQKSGDSLDLNQGIVKAPTTLDDGTINRNLRDLVGDVIDVRNYGAKSDGVTDDTAAFNKAASDATNKGGVVYVPHGTYKITEIIPGQFISFGHPTFIADKAVKDAMNEQLTDLYNDYVHKQKGPDPEAITGVKAFSSSPTVPTPAATDNSKKAMNTEWLRNAVSGDSTGLSFDNKGKLKVDPSGMSKEAIEALVKSLLPDPGTSPHDGLKTDEDGKLTVDPSELIPGTGKDGLVVENGKLKVKPSELAGTGLNADDANGKLSVDVNDLIPGTATDGFEVTSAGKLKVKPSEFTGDLAGDGLYKDSDGKLAINISDIAKRISSGDDAVDQSLMLAALGLPINLGDGESVEWFVNGNDGVSNASDKPSYNQLIAFANISDEAAEKMLDGKAGSTKAADSYVAAYRWGTNPNYPFKTIKGALQFIRAHYALSTEDCYITVTPLSGNSAYAGFAAGQYQSSGGKLHLRSSNASLVLVQGQGVSGETASFKSSDYVVTNFHFKRIWYGHKDTDISNRITAIVLASNNNNAYFHDCTFTLEDRTATDADGKATYFTYKDSTLTGSDLTAESNKNYDGISQTRLIHSVNGNSMYFYGGTFNVNHIKDKHILAESGAPRGALFYAEISSYIGFVKKNNTFTFTGSANTMFVAARQSMLGGYGSGTEFINTDNFKVYKLFNCQNASGFECNNWGDTSKFQGIAVPTNLTRPSDTFYSGSWHDGYTPYLTSNGTGSLQQRVGNLETETATLQSTTANLKTRVTALEKENA